MMRLNIGQNKLSIYLLLHYDCSIKVAEESHDDTICFLAYRIGIVCTR